MAFSSTFEAGKSLDMWTRLCDGYIRYRRPRSIHGMHIERVMIQPRAGVLHKSLLLTSSHYPWRFRDAQNCTAVLTNQVQSFIQPVPNHAQHPLLNMAGVLECVPPSSAPISTMAPSAATMCFPRRSRYCAYSPRPHVREEDWVLSAAQRRRCRLHP